MNKSLKAFGYSSDACLSHVQFKVLDIDDKEDELVKISLILDYCFIPRPRYDISKFDNKRFSNIVDLKYSRYYDTLLYFLHKRENLSLIPKVTELELMYMVEKEDYVLRKYFVQIKDKELKERALFKIGNFFSKKKIPAPDFTFDGIELGRKLRGEEKSEFFNISYEDSLRALGEFKEIKGVGDYLSPYEFIASEDIPSKEKLFLSLIDLMKSKQKQKILVDDKEMQEFCNTLEMQYNTMFDLFCEKKGVKYDGKSVDLTHLPDSSSILDAFYKLKPDEILDKELFALIPFNNRKKLDVIGKLAFLLRKEGIESVEFKYSLEECFGFLKKYQCQTQKFIDKYYTICVKIIN